MFSLSGMLCATTFLSVRVYWLWCRVSGLSLPFFVLDGKWGGDKIFGIWGFKV